MRSEDNVSLIKAAFDALEGEDIAKLETMMPPDMHANTIQYMHMARSAAPDMRIRIEDVISERDKVVTRWTAHGTHTGQAKLPGFGDVKPTGKTFAIEGITIHQVANGKIAEVWSKIEQEDSPYCQIEALLRLGIIGRHGS